MSERDKRSPFVLVFGLHTWSIKLKRNTCVVRTQTIKRVEGRYVSQMDITPNLNRLKIEKKNSIVKLNVKPVVVKTLSDADKSLKRRKQRDAKRSKLRCDYRAQGWFSKVLNLTKHAGVSVKPALDKSDVDSLMDFLRKQDIGGTLSDMCGKWLNGLFDSVVDVGFNLIEQGVTTDMCLKFSLFVFDLYQVIIEPSDIPMVLMRRSFFSTSKPLLEIVASVALHYMSHRNRRVRKTVVPYSAQLDTDTYHAIVRFVFSLFELKVASDEPIYIKVMRMIRGLDSRKRDFSTFANMAMELFQKLYDYIAVKCFGCAPRKFVDALHPDFDKWVFDVRTLHRRFQENKLPMNMHYATEVHNLEIRGLDLVNEIARYEHTRVLLPGLREVMRIVDALTREFVYAGVFGSKARMEPVTIFICGAPGTGKSTILPSLIDELITRVIDDEHLDSFIENPDEHKFVVRHEQKHFDMYRNQLVSVLDDYGQAKDAPGMPDNEHMFFIRAKGTFPFPLPAAELSLKGKLFFSSRIIVATSNMGEILSNSVISVEAIKRRIDVKIEVAPKQQYCTAATSSRPFAERRLDRTKLAPKLVVDYDVYDFKVSKGFSGPQYTMSYEQVMDLCTTMYHDAYRKFLLQGEERVSVIQRGLSWRAQNGLRSEVPSEYTRREVKTRDVVLEEYEGQMKVVNLVPLIPGSNRYISHSEEDSDDESIDFDFPLDAEDLLLIKEDWWDEKKRMFNNVYLFLKLKFQESPYKWLSVIVGTPAVVGISIGLWNYFWRDKMCEGVCDICRPGVRCDIAGNWFVEKDEVLVKHECDCCDKHESCQNKSTKKEGEFCRCVPKFPIGHKSSWVVGHARCPDHPCESSTHVQGQYEAQYAGDENLRRILLKVLEHNVYSLHFEGDHRGFAMFTHSRCLLLPTHYVVQFRTMKEDEKILLKASGDNESYELEAGMLTTPLIFIPGQDLCVLHLPRVREHRDARSFFIPFEEIGDRFKSGSVCALFREPGTSLFGFQVCKYNATKANFTYYMDGKAITIQSFVRYGSTSSKGMCGLPLFVVDPSSRSQKIIGIHVAGCSRDSIASVFDVSKLPYVAQLNYSEFQTMKVCGKIPIPVGMSMDTSIRRSPLYGHLWDVLKAPSVLRKVMRNGVVVDPLEKALVEFDTPTAVLDDSHVSVVWDYIFSHIITVSSVRNGRVLSYEEAVTGVLGDPNLKGVNRSTSSGYPYNVWPRIPGIKGKQRFFGVAGDYEFGSEDEKYLRSRVESVIVDARNGIRSEHYATIALKDELRKHEKIESVSTRLFSGTPVDLLICITMYFGDFASWMIENRVKNHCCVGINPYGSEWDWLAKTLLASGPKFFDTDYKGFDKSQIQGVLKDMVRGINAWYDDGVENARVRGILWMEVWNSKHVVFNKILEWSKSLPSGFPLTTIINCLYNLFNFVYCWYMFNDYQTKMLKFTFVDFDIEVFGDDVTGAYGPSKEQFVLQIPSLMGRIGMNMTSTDKGTELVMDRPFHSLTFLKRSFRYDDDMNRFLAPLTLETILEMPNWSKKGPLYDEIACTNVDRSLHELSLHSRETFVRYARLLLFESRDKMNFVPPVVQYLTLKRETCAFDNLW